MNCNSVTLNSLDARCDTSAGGIKRILIALKDDVLDIHPSDANDGVIDNILMATGKYFSQWLFRKNTGNYTTTFSSDPAIGSQAFTTELNLQFTKVEQNKRLEIQSAINASAVIIIEDMYGQFILLGKDNDVTVTAVNQQSGTAISDLNGYTLTFQDISLELPYFVEESKINGLLAPPKPEPEA